MGYPYGSRLVRSMLQGLQARADRIESELAKAREELERAEKLLETAAARLARLEVELASLRREAERLG